MGSGSLWDILRAGLDLNLPFPPLETSGSQSVSKDPAEPSPTGSDSGSQTAQGYIDVP